MYRSATFLRFLAGVATVCAPCGIAYAKPTPPPAYVVAGSIPVSDGGWDYARVDPETNTLFVARATTVTAVPLDGGAAHDMGAVSHGHAVVPLPGGKLAVTAGASDLVQLFDQASGAEAGTVKVGKDPDGAILNPANGQLLVMNAKGGTVSVVDPALGKVVRTITLKPGLEYPQLDAKGILYINNEDLNALHVVNPATGAVLGTIPLTGCTGPSGLAYDQASNRLISACDNGKAAVVDVASRKVVALLAIGKGPDAVILDAERRQAFIPCGGSGTLSQIALDGGKGPHVIATIATEKGARTGALDPRTGIVYLPSARFAAPAAAGGRPVVVPGSAHILILRPKGA